MDRAAPDHLPGLMPASALPNAASSPNGVADAPAWSVAALAGRLVELSGADAPAALTVAVDLVLDAQRHGEPAAWVMARESTFFPPDVAEHGVDLAALVVARVPDAASIPRAASTLLRSGAFSLVVLDLGEEAAIPTPLQARLVKLAQGRSTAVVCLTIKPSDAASIGSLVSLRGEARRVETARGLFTCEVRIIKDKHQGPTWKHKEDYHGPVGLC